MEVIIMKKTLVIIIVIISLLAVQTFAFAQVMIHTRDRDQTSIDLNNQELARTELKLKLQITPDAATHYQHRMHEQKQSSYGFTDVEKHWAREQLQYAHDWGLVLGYPDGSFNPEGHITGLEGVIMMTRLMNCLEGIEAGPTDPGEIDWEGIPDWAMAQLNERNALRIMTQTPYYSEAHLNRLQFAVMLAKALDIDLIEVPKDIVVFLDQDEIDSADLVYIHTLRTLGVIQGNNGCFYPDQLVKRAEAACMLTRIIDILK
jgi:hypothetical protein